jgi:malonyl-CoA/methylmalonyl-CoA synthetase
MRTTDLDRSDVDASTVAAWRVHTSEAEIDPSSLRRSLADGDLPGLIAETAFRAPNAIALSVKRQTITHGQLDTLAASMAADLKALGAGRSDRLLLVADVGIEEIAAYMAILRLGATAVLAHPSLTASEVEAMRAQSGAEWLIGSGESLSRASSRTGALREAIGLRPDDRSVASAILGSVTSDALPPGEVDPESPAVLAFTSGTTGNPKATPLSHRNLLASIRGVMLAWRWTPRDHLVHSLPISHQHGLSGVHATLISGSRATLLGKLDPEQTLEAVVAGGATVHFGVAAIHQRLLADLGDRAGGLQALRLAVSGSGPLPTETALAYEKAVGDSLLERYGTSESGLDVSNPYHGERHPGSVGLELPGVEAAVAGPGGVVLDSGEVGEIMIRGPQVFGGYEGVAARDQPFEHGWFRTGDLGSFDPETSYLRIVGRTKEVIISGGMNVYPREVEDVLLRLPDVADVAVIGVESATWGEEVVAVVVSKGATRDSLAATASEHLAPYKRPKRFVFVEEIPRTPVGKLMSGRLRDLISPSEAPVPSDGIH